jgi:hypothetical protein
MHAMGFIFHQPLSVISSNRTSHDPPSLSAMFPIASIVFVALLSSLMVNAGCPDGGTGVGLSQLCNIGTPEGGSGVLPITFSSEKIALLIKV